MNDTRGEYKDCVVAYLDILGFKQFVPDSTDNPEKLQNLIQAMQAVHAIPAGQKKVSTDVGGQRTIDIRRRFFSDTLVFFHCQRPDDIPHLFFLIRYVQDRLWEKDYCLRGSVVLGPMWWRAEDDDVTVGRGLIEAYEAESELALYPRIMVSAELKQYVVDKDIGADPFGPAERPLNDYIRQDADGIHFLDLLNAGITRRSGEELVRTNGKGYSVQYYPSNQSTHSDVIRAVRKIVGGNGAATSSKVRQKYDWLKTYCNLHARNR